MRLLQTLWQHRVTRFVIVGVSNTALHFSILNFSFYVLGQSKIVSSLIATMCAVTFSFVLNRSFVFASKDTRPAQQLALFVVVTLSGMLLIHNAVYAFSLALLSNWDQQLSTILHTVLGISFSKDFIDINVSTVMGAMVAMVWNYNGYRLFVFKDKKQHEEESETA